MRSAQNLSLLPAPGRNLRAANAMSVMHPSRRTVLITHPYIAPSGGGEVVAAYALQALSRDFEVSVATLAPLDLKALNRSFGTFLRDGDFETLVAPQHYRWAASHAPGDNRLLKQHLTVAWARQLAGKRRFDLLFSTQNEVDFGRPGIQYIHYPGWYFPPHPDHSRWFHRIPGAIDVYHRLCVAVSKSTEEGIEKNLTLVNSSFI